MADPYDVHQPDLWMPPPPHPLADPWELPEKEEIKLPLTYPLWQGVYTYPWHFDTLRIWIILGLIFTFLALLATLEVHLLTNQGNQEWVEYRLLYMLTTIYTAVFVLVLAWFSSYPGAFFLDAVQETASGREAIRWPENSVVERFLKLAHVLFVVMICLIPLVFLALPLKEMLQEGILGWILLGLPLPFLFPLILLSSLAHQSPVYILHGKVLSYVVRRPVHVGVVVLVSVALLYLGSLLAYWTIFRLNFLLAPLAGYFWAASLLIYGRLLGRVAWLISREDAAPERSPVPRRKKKGKKSASSAASRTTGSGPLETTTEESWP
jgi:hypothetical protein